MFNYALRLVRNQKIVVKDDRPELLNYLRMGLPDCELVVVYQDQEIVVDQTGISSLVQERLRVLKALLLCIESIRAPTMIYPPFVGFDRVAPNNVHCQKLAEKYQVHLGQLHKHQALVQRDCQDTLNKCWIFFEAFASRIIQAQSARELREIQQDINYIFDEAGRNS